jgi:hypothetical protein
MTKFLFSAILLGGVNPVSAEAGRLLQGERRSGKKAASTVEAQRTEKKVKRHLRHAETEK